MTMTRYALSMHTDFTRRAMTPRERELRARASRLLAHSGLLHGSWIERERRCGRATCWCAQPGGRGHPATLVYRQQHGKLRQLYVSRPQRDTVRRWLEQDRELRDILEELWEIHWQRVRAGKARD
jgi:hypothetical protein